MQYGAAPSQYGAGPVPNMAPAAPVTVNLHQVTSENQHQKRLGFQVRFCRPAPSPGRGPLLLTLLLINRPWGPGGRWAVQPTCLCFASMRRRACSTATARFATLRRRSTTRSMECLFALSISLGAVAIAQFREATGTQHGLALDRHHACCHLSHGASVCQTHQGVSIILSCQ